MCVPTYVPTPSLYNTESGYSGFTVCESLSTLTQTVVAELGSRHAGPAPPGTSIATLLPLSRIWSSLVTRFPSAVISLRMRKEQHKRSEGSCTSAAACMGGMPMIP